MSGEASSNIVTAMRKGTGRREAGKARAVQMNPGVSVKSTGVNVLVKRRGHSSLSFPQEVL